MSRETFTLIKGGEDMPISEAAEYITKKIEGSKIEEERTFNRGEVLGLIEQLAKKEGFGTNDLEIAREYFDKNDQLILLEIVVNEARAKNSGWGDIAYQFMIKGSHTQEAGFTLETGISRVYATIDDPKMCIAGGIIAEYKNGKWELNPGHISPTTAKDIEIIDD
jgi:hypothetical protein